MEPIRSYVNEVQRTLDSLAFDVIERVILTLEEARLANQTIFIMGNGGSAATASHFTCDLAKNTRLEGWPNFRVMGLTDNMPVFSALDGLGVCANHLDSMLFESAAAKQRHRGIERRLTAKGRQQDQFPCGP